MKGTALTGADERSTEIIELDRSALSGAVLSPSLGNVVQREAPETGPFPIHMHVAALTSFMERPHTCGEGNGFPLS